MDEKQITTENTEYVFHYEVETSLWKSPFKKTITDELEYAKFRQKNAYHDLKQFVDADPLRARKLAFNYLRSMIEVMFDVVYSIVELERERRYYNQARIPVQTGKIDLSGIGLADAEVMSGLMDWNEFADTFADIDIDAVLDTTAIYDRQCELLI